MKHLFFTIFLFVLPLLAVCQSITTPLKIEGKILFEKAEVTKTVVNGTKPQVSAAQNHIEVIPPKYETVTEVILMKAASTHIITLSPEYRKVHEIIKVSSGNYKTITKTVLIAPATIRIIEEPAEYKTITKKVLKTPATTRSVIPKS